MVRGKTYEVTSVARILIVDDDRSIRRTLEKFLGSEGYEVATAQDAPGAIAAAESADLMLLDLGLPGGSGFDVLAALADRPRPPTVLVVTARDDMQSTVKAIQLGAYEYLVKPVDIDRLRQMIRQALESRDARSQLEAFVTRSADGRLVGDILGKSAAIREVWKQIGAVSTTRAPVLIAGESGTGKELVARAIHLSSADRDRPFVAVNCTALAPGVLESELFGHVKGAFTGAIADRPGRCELAGKGTLFLDEIAEIPFDLQAKLLRVVQERTFERVGDARPLPLEARIIAATHRDLPAMVARGTFREDLFYRLRVVEIAMPALRERREDIPRLAGHFLARIAVRDGRRPLALSRDAVKALLDYEFPGNVRELENLLEGAAALVVGDAIEAADLQFGIARGAAGTGAIGDDAKGGVSLRHVENAHISRILAQVKGNKSRAAKLLGVSRRTLYRKRV